MIATETATDSETAERRILIADDQKDVLDALQLLLKAHGYVLETVSTPADLLAALAERQFDLLLMDLNYARDTTSGREGLDVLGHLQEMPDAPPVVAMTGWATVGLAVAAMQYGVSDFVEKPGATRGWWKSWKNRSPWAGSAVNRGGGRIRRGRPGKRPSIIFRNRNARSPRPRPFRKSSFPAKPLNWRGMKSRVPGSRQARSAGITSTSSLSAKILWVCASRTLPGRASPRRF